MTLGERIRRLRGEAELSQVKLAEMADVDQKSISRLENDAIGEPSAKLICGVAAALGVATDALRAGVAVAPKRSRKKSGRSRRTQRKRAA